MKKFMKMSIMLTLWVLSGLTKAGVDQNSVYSLSLEQNTGHPRFQWKALPTDNEFEVARYHRGRIIGCPDSVELQEYINDINITKCFKLVKVNTNSSENYLLEYDSERGVLRYTDKSIVIDEASPDEYEYSVKISSDASTALTALWTASCPIIDGQDPIERWVNNFNQRIGVGANWLKRSDIPNMTINDGARKVLVKISEGKELILFVNSKYVAVFTNRGNLVGLTHRALGEEFMTYRPEFVTQTAVSRDVFSTSNGWNWFIKYGKSNDAKETICTQINTSGGGYVSSLNKIPAYDLVDGKLKFSWNNVAALNGSVVAEWDLSTVDDFVDSNSLAGLKGKLTVSGQMSSGGIICAAFPQMVGLGLKGAGDSADTKVEFILPSSVGGSANNNGSISLGYPAGVSYNAITNNGRQLQMSGILKNDKALLISTNDINNNPVTYFFSNYWLGNQGASLNPADSFIEHYAKEGSVAAGGNLLNEGYSVILRPMCGNWARLSKTYRAWAMQQSWVKSNTPQQVGVGVNKHTIERSDINQQLKHGLFWWLEFVESDLNKFIDRVQKFNKITIGNTDAGGDIPIGVHLYAWYQELFDYNIPHFTDKPGVAGVIRAIQNKYRSDQSLPLINDKTIVVPYINVNGIDFSNRPGNEGCAVGSHGWYQNNFFYDSIDFFNGWDLSKLAMQRSVPDAAINNEIYYGSCYKGSATNTPDPKFHILADPSQPNWQALVAHNTQKVLNLGANGVYYDTFGVGYHPDYSPEHGHGGHGNWWLQGQQRIGADAQAQLAANSTSQHKLLASEYFSEGLMPFIDIVFNYAEPKLNDIPLVWSVYSGYQLYAGNNANKAATLKAKNAIWGRTFVWGGQLGLSTFGFLCPGNTCTTDIDYLKKLATIRNSTFINSYLAFGEFINTADDLNPINKQEFFGSDKWCSSGVGCEGTAPSVWGARWKDAYGESEIILLTNTSDVSVNATINIPAIWKDVEICDVDEQCNPTAGDGTALVQMLAHDVKVLRPKILKQKNGLNSVVIPIDSNQDDGWEFNDSGIIYRPDGYGMYAVDGGNYFGTWYRPDHYGAALRFKISAVNKKPGALMSARLNLYRNGVAATGEPKVAIYAYKDTNCHEFSDANLPYRDGIVLTNAFTLIEFPDPSLNKTNDWIEIDVTNIMRELMLETTWSNGDSSICFIGKNLMPMGAHEFGFRDSAEGASFAPRIIMDLK